MFSRVSFAVSNIVAVTGQGGKELKVTAEFTYNCPEKLKWITFLFLFVFAICGRPVHLLLRQFLTASRSLRSRVQYW